VAVTGRASRSASCASTLARAAASSASSCSARPRAAASCSASSAFVGCFARRFVVVYVLGHFDFPEMGHFESVLSYHHSAGLLQR
jgi:hypothetical protein